MNNLVQQISQQHSVRKIGPPSGIPQNVTEFATLGHLEGLGIFSNDLELKINKKITNDSSIMTVEFVAIREAINEIAKKAQRQDKIGILTDLLAASISLKNYNKQQARQDLTRTLQPHYYKLEGII